MTDRRFDVLVVGSGPAGSIAALVLAQGGARVAIVDKATLPRDKACGDLIGPRGVQLLRDLRLALPGAPHVGDMIVVGPTGNRVRLPARAGSTYPGHAIIVQRTRFDAALQEAAANAGAEVLVGRAEEPIWENGRLGGFSMSTPSGPLARRVRADVVVGADGATSRVAEVARLVDPNRVMWGFAVRAYIDATIRLPHIVFWTPTRRAGFPGYGWAFPSDAGTNVGLGIGVLADRGAGRRAARDLGAFLAHASQLGVLDARCTRRAMSRPLGAWLKMGLVGTTSAHGRVLLVGDAAGLVNPMQGEGIAQAMDSGRAAAAAILNGVEEAADDYRSYLAAAHGRYLSIAAAVQRSLLRSPRRVAALSRAVTSPGVANLLAGAWSIVWNDLLDGAQPGIATTIAAVATGLGDAMTSRSSDRRWISAHIGAAIGAR